MPLNGTQSRCIMPNQVVTKSPHPLKIGMVIDTSLDPTDGVQQYVLTLGAWLSSQGHDVHYLAGETHERTLNNLHSLTRNITVKFNGNRTTIPLYASRRKLREFLREQQFDVLHVQTPHHPFLAQHIIQAANPGTAVVGTFHILPYNWLARYSTKALGWLLRPSLVRIDQMLAVSPQAARFEQWAFGNKAEVLPNVLEYEVFRRAQPMQQYADEVLTILFLGRLVERKGCRYLLEAIAMLDRDALPAFRVVICGKGALRVPLQEYVNEHGLDDLVEFAGFVSEADKPRYYASADIAVFPSTGGESFGIVLLEAMASGKAAVLAGDNPGYASVMEPRPEVLFNPRDTELLAEKISALLNNKEQRNEIADWGEDYSQRFDVEIVGPKLVDLYNSLLEQKNMR